MNKFKEDIIKKGAIVFSTPEQLMELCNFAFRNGHTGLLGHKLMTAETAKTIFDYCIRDKHAVCFTLGIHPVIEPIEYFMVEDIEVFDYKESINHNPLEDRFASIYKKAMQVGQKAIQIEQDNKKLSEQVVKLESDKRRIFGDLMEAKVKLAEEKIINSMLTGEGKDNEWLVKRYEHIKEREELENDI